MSCHGQPSKAVIDIGDRGFPTGLSRRQDHEKDQQDQVRDLHGGLQDEPQRDEALNRPPSGSDRPGASSPQRADEAPGFFVAGLPMPRSPFPDIEQNACALHDLSLRLLGEGKVQEALDTALRAGKTFAAVDGSQSPDVANTLLVAAQAAIELGVFDDAFSYANRAWRILHKINDPSNRDLVRLQARALGRMGDVHVARGEYERARKAYQQALVLAQRFRGDELASALNNLAVVGKFLGRWDEAKRFYQRALRITRRLGNASDIASILHNLGGLEHARRRFSRGIPYAREGLALREQACGKQHVAVAADAAALAALLEGAGELDEARRLYRYALATYKKNLGPTHFEVGFNLANLAALEHGAGQWAKAEKLYLRALEIEENALGTNHPFVATTLSNLAALRGVQGKTSEQRRLLAQALAIYQNTLGPRHPDTIECARALEKAPT